MTQQTMEILEKHACDLAPRAKCIATKKMFIDALRERYRGDIALDILPDRRKLSAVREAAVAVERAAKDLNSPKMIYLKIDPDFSEKYIIGNEVIEDFYPSHSQIEAFILECLSDYEKRDMDLIKEILKNTFEQMTVKQPLKVD